LALLGALCWLTSPALADPSFRAFLDKLWPEAQAQGVSRTSFDQAFAGVVPDLALPDLDIPGRGLSTAPQAEFVKPPGDYLSPRSLGPLIESGRRLAKQHQATLAAIEKQYGIPAGIILAIWGRETAYGTYKLPHNGIKALATQAYLGRRKDRFRAELLAALKLIEERHIALPDFKTSWAGAFGLTQFMPTDFNKYAVDFDGDGRRDLFRSVPDALASTAAQLTGYGWQKGRPWGFEVAVPRSLDCTLEGPHNQKPLREWVQLGLTRPGGLKLPGELSTEQASLVMPAGPHGPAFLGLANFYALKSYNFADLYVLFVGHLADRISGAGPFIAPWGPIAPMREADAMEMQRRLQSLGLDIGDKIDGKVGTRTRNSVGAYQKRHALALDCWPTQALLEHMRRTSPGRAER
jgi:lytic murein transglycosylase